MRVIGTSVGIAGACALGCLLAGSTTFAQEVKPAARVSEPGLQRIVVYNGPVRAVHFFGEGLSRRERASLTDLERAENTVALADQLQALRAQYVSDERQLEAQRFALMQRVASTSGGYAPGVYPDQRYPVDVNALISFAETYAGYPGYAGYRAFTPGWGGYGYGELPAWWNWGGGTGAGYSNTANETLALGVLNEGPIKTELARVLASNATSDFLAQANRNLEDAVARVGQSDRLRAALEPVDQGVRPAGYEPTTAAHVDITMKDGSKVSGKLVREDNDRIVVQTDKGEVEIRKSETASIAKQSR